MAVPRTERPELTRALNAGCGWRRFAYGRHRHDRGHPLALSPALAGAIAADRKAKDLSDAVRRNARLVGYLDVDDPGVLRNVNRSGD